MLPVKSYLRALLLAQQIRGVRETLAHRHEVSVGLRPPRILHTGTELTKPPLPLERRRQLSLDVREARYGGCCG
jgi:hypothetical protein